MARKLFSDIFNDVAFAPTDEYKVMVLQENDSVPLRNLLQFAYDPSITLDVKTPEYIPNTEVNGYSSNSLYTEYKRLYIFTSVFQKINLEKKTNILQLILESIDEADAVLLAKIVDKNLAEFGLTKDIINAAFPNLIKF